MFTIHFSPTRAQRVLMCLGLAAFTACGDDAPSNEDAADASIHEPVNQRDASTVDHNTDASAEKERASDTKSPQQPTMMHLKDAGAPTDDVHQNDAGTPEAASPSTTPVADEIATVMTDAVYGFGAGGTITIDARPVILFKDGQACFDANFVVRGLDVAAHQVMYPKSWSRWMEIDGKAALKNGDNWRVLDFQLKYPPNASSLTFDKMFSRINAAGGGASDALVVATRDIRLTGDHHIQVGSFAGVTSSAGTVTSTPPDQRGTYAIDGYTVELKWDNGKTTTTSFYYNDKDPKVIYLGGVAYLTRQ